MLLRVAVVELPAMWGEHDRALAAVDAILAGGSATDLVLLPEASLTGYVSPAIDFDLTRFAEPIDGPTAHALAALAKKHATHLVGPLILREDACCFNATVGFGPDGTRTFLYKKRHPWIPEEWAAPGTDPHPLVDIAGVTVTVACCYDLHFLAREAKHVLAEADVLLFPSAWVEERDSRPRRLANIALDHGLWVVAANWGPGIPHVRGQGGSMIVDPKGDVVTCVAPGAFRADAAIEVA